MQWLAERPAWPRWQDGTSWSGSLLAGAMSLVFLLWIVFVFDGARVTDGVDDLGELVAALCAGLACGVAARRAPAGRTSWALLSASSFAWAIGEALWSYYDLIRGIQVPFPSLADAGFLTAVPLACAGLLLFPGSPPRTAHRVQGLLDGCIIATALLYASWATILGPLYRAHHGGLLKQSISLTYPMSDVVMVSLVIILIARAGRRNWASLGLVMAGVMAFAVADSSFSYLTEVNNYGSGNFLDTGWVAGYLLIGLGGLWAVTAPSGVAESAEASTVSLVAPYAAGARRAGGDVGAVAPGPAHRARVLGHGFRPRLARPRSRGSAVVGSGCDIPVPRSAPINRLAVRCTSPTPTSRSRGGSPVSGYHTGPSVRLEGSYPGGTSSYRRPAGPGNVSAKRVTAWIVRSIMLATTVFAVLDLSLLVSSAHH